MRKLLGPLVPAAILGGFVMAFGFGNRLDRVAHLPAAPYDRGPTLSGQTAVEFVDPRQVDAVCRAMNAALPQRLQMPAIPKGKSYSECYDPWNDVMVVPDMPSEAEKERLRLHSLGHARGGTHASDDGSGPWTEASWARFYAAPTMTAVPPATQNGAMTDPPRPFGFAPPPAGPMTGR